MSVQSITNKMFKFRSYNVKKETEKDEKKQPTCASKTPTYTANTLKKPPKKEKKKALGYEITLANNKQSPEYNRKTSVIEKKWETNKTFSPKKEAKDENKSVNLHKKLTRQ